MSKTAERWVECTRHDQYGYDHWDLVKMVEQAMAQARREALEEAVAKLREYGMSYAPQSDFALGMGACVDIVEALAKEDR